ncbi:MAG: amidohydrolase [Planctomycetia bacterium]|nr:amidohydrolase [Planctomycetia bacterium]
MNKRLSFFVLALMLGFLQGTFSPVRAADLTPEGKFADSAVKEKSPLINDINRNVWQFSESRFQEVKSSKFISDLLEKEGFHVFRDIPDMPTAFIARYGSGSPVIGITAEYDALPGLNQKAGIAREDPDPARVNGHGCAHSALGAGSVGAALAVKEWLKDKPGKGTVVLLGTPGEESGYGKIHMLRRKCFDGIDVVLSWHPMDLNHAWGRRALGVHNVQFKFTGTAAHAGGAPEKGRSAVDAAELTNIGVNYLREHVSSQTRMHFAWLDSGPKAPNVVPAHAALFYYIRTPNVKDGRETLDRMIDIARGAALMTHTKMEYEIVGGTYDFMPNPIIIKVLSDAFMETGGPKFEEEEFKIARQFLDILPADKRAEAIAAGALHDGVAPEEFAKRPLSVQVEPYSPFDNNLITVSFDLGDISHLIPTAQIYIATGPPHTGLHTWQQAAMAGTSIGDKAAQSAARAIALASIRLYLNPSLVAKAKEELKKTEKEKYRSLFPESVKPLPVN